MKTPITPQQAIANFHLLKELDPKNNTHAEYVAAVHELADTVLELGILGDDEHPAPLISWEPVSTGMQEPTHNPGEITKDQIRQASDDPVMAVKLFFDIELTGLAAERLRDAWKNPQAYASGINSGKPNLALDFKLATEISRLLAQLNPLVMAYSANQD